MPLRPQRLLHGASLSSRPEASGKYRRISAEPPPGTGTGRLAPSGTAGVGGAALGRFPARAGRSRPLLPTVN